MDESTDGGEFKNAARGMVKRTWPWLTVAVVLVLVAAVLATDEGAEPPADTEPPAGAEPAAELGVGDAAVSDGESTTVPTGSPTSLTVRLSEGEPVAGVVSAAVNRVEGRPLDDAEVAAVTGRLPAWEVGEGADAPGFNLPAETLPPPRAGATVREPFPPDSDGGDPPEVESGPLRVLRVQPEGEVGTAPFMSITFSESMVPLATLAQLDQADVPAKMTPELPGSWQWIGTRTLRFEHDPEVFDRLPMATSYAVEVPAGTTAESGAELAETVRFEFSTPPPTMLSFTPRHDSLGLSPVFVATFDQRVDAAAVLENTTLRADGAERDLRLATEAEIEADDEAKRRTGLALEGTWAAFTPVAALEPDSALVVEVGPQVPSAEGPAKSGASSVVDARTFASLRVQGRSCTSGRPCGPGDWMSVFFNNRLDPATLDVSAVEITPGLAGARVWVQHQSVLIAGDTVGDRVYEVVLPASLGDEFGQTLGEPTSVKLHIERARPFIRGPLGGIVTLDPLVDQQTIPVMVRNHEQLRVRLYDVDPRDYPSFLAFTDRWERSRDGLLPDPPWPTAHDELVDTGIDSGIDSNTAVEVRIDLAEVLNGDHGHVVAVVEGVGRFADMGYDDEDYWGNRAAVVWAQSTDVGLDVINEHREAVLWTTDLRSGQPLADVEIELMGGEATLITDGEGLARATLPREVDWVVATLGDDQAIAEALEVWSRTDRLIWYTVDDRGTYRPGETLRLKGWVRGLNLTGDGRLELLPDRQVVGYRVSDPFGSELFEGSVRLDEHGGFDLEIDLPEGANLGDSWLEFRGPQTYDNNWHYHSFAVAEFRRPEFEVSARLESPAPFFGDEPATVAVDAEYFSGGPLPDAEVLWTVTTGPGSYSPPNWSEFTFGVSTPGWNPWWSYDEFDGVYESFSAGDGRVGGFGDEAVRETFSGRTDSSGSHHLRMDFDGNGDHLPTSVRAEAQVVDVNRQQWASSTDLLVHAAGLYVGIRSERSFVRAGDGLEVEAVVTDIDGNAVAGRAFEVTAARLVEERVDGEWTEVAVDPETCTLASTDSPVVCEFEAAVGGRYRIDASVLDAAGRANRSELTLWVSGARGAVPSRNIELETARLVPDAETYAAGDTAEILVVSPFSSATGLLVLARHDVIESRTFEISDHAAVVEIPITDDHVPELTVHVEIVATTPRTADDGTVPADVAGRPAFASGQVRLRVPPAQRTLDVTAAPAAPAVRPGSATSVTVQVNDADGRGVDGADVLLVVADEAVLALSGYALVDPLEVFYQPPDVYLGAQRGRAGILLANPQELLDSEDDRASAPHTSIFPGVALSADGDMADAAAPESADESLDVAGFSAQGLAVAVRSNTDALALFDPEVVTDSDGAATVAFDLPDSLTRYRIMAVAVDGADRFGSTESTITAQLPLQVRPSAPRFLNFGDRFELPVVVQNRTGAAADVDVVVQTSNLSLDGPAGKRVVVPANDRVEVRFAASADSVGTARLRVAAVSDDHADAQEVSLPVYTPATSEAFATYGALDPGVVSYSLTAPEGVFGQFGGLAVDASSTALQTLTDAVLYLTEYRYASSDAYAGRILAISALRNVLGAFDTEGLPTTGGARRHCAARHSRVVGPAARRRRIRLVGAQGSLLPLSVDPGDACARCRPRGGLHGARTDGAERPAVPARDRTPDTGDYSNEAADMLIAYALHVRALDGDVDAAAARSLWDRRGPSLELDALAWIWPVVDDPRVEARIEQVFNNRVVETAQTAAFVNGYGEGDYLVLASDRRTDGIVLDALIDMAPDSDLIPKVVAGLLADRVEGRWSNAQENSFILLALQRYFEAFEAVDPDFVARVWLGDAYIAAHQFTGRSTVRASTLVPTAELIAAAGAEPAPTALILQNEGAGRLYYRLGLRYAPLSHSLEPLDRGFVVQRSYEAVHDPADVWLDTDGAVHVAAGAEVRVTLTMVNDSRRTNMVLVDPLPAGLEPLNPAVAVTGELPPGPDEDGPDSFWWRTWYQHQNLRDDRSEAFAFSLRAGTHEYSYVARATTPGTFVVPPARAEEIYAPEVFGRSASDTVVIEDRQSVS